jgi:hypothetical protein
MRSSFIGAYDTAMSHRQLGPKVTADVSGSLYPRHLLMQTVAMTRRFPYLAVLGLVLVSCSSDRTTSVGVTTITPFATVTPTLTVDVSTAVADDGATTLPTTASSTTTSIEPATTVGDTSAPAARDPSAWVVGSEEGDPQVSAAPGVCEPFYTAIAGGSYTVQRCGIWNAIGGQRMWTVTKGATDRFFAIVWQQSAPNTWIPLLRAVEESPGVWSDFTIRTGNIDSGSNDELVSGARIAGTGGYLDVSVVDIRSGNPRVMAVYNESTKGVAVLRPGGGVEIWSGVYADTDPGCCPSSFVQHLLVADGPDWLLASGATLPAGDPAIPLTEL